MTAVRPVIIQTGLTHAPVTVATQEMDEPAMVNKLLDQMYRFHKKIFHKSRYTNFGPLTFFFVSELSILKVMILKSVQL